MLVFYILIEVEIEFFFLITIIIIIIMNIPNRDKSLLSMQSMLNISRNYGFSINVSIKFSLIQYYCRNIELTCVIHIKINEKLDDSFTSCKLLMLLEQIEKNNDILNHVI